ncbi:MAG: 4-(cytidine 5'-diphospho)-2-C-methyl-D-erythritol kinase [Rhodospirillales bacterium]
MTDSESAPAKINLFLHIVGKRADGYHLLDSLAVFAGIGDRLFAEPSDGLSLRLIGPFAAGLDGESDNLVLRAARALAEAAGLPPRATLVLEKNLPVASGIGGGSADAAAALRLLSRLWGIGLDRTVLHAIATRLGADVPVCLGSRPTRMRGIGDRLDPAPHLPDCGLLLVNPGVALGTADVFRARQGGFSGPVALPRAWDSAATMAEGLRGLSNDLQPPAIALRPAIGDVMSAIATQPGCLLSRMSGSGASCFGIFASAREAEEAASALSPRGWWSWGGPIGH